MCSPLGPTAAPKHTASPLQLRPAPIPLNPAAAKPPDPRPGPPAGRQTADRLGSRSGNDGGLRSTKAGPYPHQSSWPAFDQGAWGLRKVGPDQPGTYREARDATCCRHRASRAALAGTGTRSAIDHLHAWMARILIAQCRVPQFRSGAVHGPGSLTARTTVIVPPASARP